MAVLAVAVYFDSALVRLDLAVVRTLHRMGFEQATTLASGVTALGATRTVFLVAAAAAASFLLRGAWHGAVAVAVSVTATQAVVFAIKAIVARSRPPDSSAIVDAAGHAFPSAHAASGVALYGLLVLIALPHLRGGTRIAACFLALLGVGALGLTRVYLGAHYPSDVLAGWLVGAVIAVGALQLARALRAHMPRPA